MKEQVIECQDSITLSCECGERIVLLGRGSDWYDEGRLDFACECGNTLALDDQLLNAEDTYP